MLAHCQKLALHDRPEVQGGTDRIASHVFIKGGGSQDDLLQGVSPSSTIRDIEAACGPLSAASGLLDTTALPPAKDAAIIPLLWTRLVSGLLQFSKLHNTA